MTAKCIFCKQEFDREEVLIGADGFAYCPMCNHPMFDISIQDKDHWVWDYLTEEQKEEYGYYD